jgi:hypothetical protein
MKLNSIDFRGAYRFTDVMASARPETLKRIRELQSKIQPDDGCVILFSSVSFHPNPVRYLNNVKVQHCHWLPSCYLHVIQTIPHVIQNSLCILLSVLTVPYSLFTPWCRILFEKLLVIQLVKQQSAFVWNPKVYYRVHRSPLLDPVVSQLNPLAPSKPISLKSSLILSSHLRLGLPSGLLLSELPTKIL